LLSGSYLYQSVAASPDLNGLKVIHPGLWLGTIKQSEFKGSRFEPAHALAMALKPGEATRVIIVDEKQAYGYLKGEHLSHHGSDGWVLVCVNQYPIGWGKRVNGIVKNLYPRGLRWM
jgi:NOL1/NOP2/fmu family ribosome biogenesis protein